MDFVHVIEAKKLGRELSKEQLTFFAQQAADPDSKDYQLAAMLMAIRLNGMTPKETATLTMAMAETGRMLTPDVGGVPVDKHSTGGVGDTTTLVLAPLVAAAGGKVVKMSGRGLGHTGGTIDKLESIPGMRVELPEEEFINIARTVGCCVVGQSKGLVPADKRLYALRDVTSTVDSIPLIASSIMSKKLAGGAQAIVLDVKVGSGALMKTKEDCIELSKTMVNIGAFNGRNVVALITGMQEPLGSHVGNALEVKEAIDMLSGRVEGPLLNVSLMLGEQMLVASGVCTLADEARARLLDALHSGRGLQKLKEMIAAQGGDARVCDDVGLLPAAKEKIDILSPQSGYIASMDTEQIGTAAQMLGAGRLSKEDVIDLAVGLVMHKRIGDRVEKGEPLATLHVNKRENLDGAREKLLKAIHIEKEAVPPAPLLFARVTADKTEVYQ